MLANFMKIAVRVLLRNKLYSSINVLGLSVGLTCCLLSITYIRNELSYDRFHEKASRIYRVTVWDTVGLNSKGYARTPSLVAPALKFYLPEVEQAVRIFDQGKGQVVSRIDRPDVRFLEDGFTFADESMLATFSFPLIRGDSRSALANPNSVVLTAAAAKKYFGDDDPVGERLNYENKYTLTITGIAADVPANSHLRFDFIASFSTLGNTEEKNPWSLQGFTYLLLSSKTSIEGEDERLQEVYEQHLRSRWWYEGLRLRLEPITDIYLHSEAMSDVPKGEQKKLWVFSAIAALIMFIAVTNYVNLATARTVQRSQEVGIRKVLGAHRAHLVEQFMCESVLATSLSLCIALVASELVMPVFNSFVGQKLHANYFSSPPSLLLLLGVVMSVGLLAGVVPAVVLSGFRPVSVLRGLSHGGSPLGKWLRPLVVIAQFAVTVALLVGAIVIERQLEFMLQANLGFDKDRVISIPLRAARPRVQEFKNELQALSGVSCASAALGTPLRGAMTFVDDIGNQKAEVNWMPVDADFIPTLGMEILEGRNLSASMMTDSADAAIINQSYATLLGGKGLVGKSVHVFGHRRIVGIVRDFHTSSLREAILPTVLTIYPSAYQSLLVKVKPGALQATLPLITEIWHKFVPNAPFGFSYLNDDYDALYKSEERLGQAFEIFAVLSTFVACLGLFGLAAFTAERRTKEMGIRKVLGASSSGIVSLLSKDFLKLIIYSNVLAWPLAYLAMNKWLQGFAFRQEIEWWIFGLIGIVTLLIAFLTISVQAMKVARANPVEALRYE